MIVLGKQEFEKIHIHKTMLCFQVSTQGIFIPDSSNSYRSINYTQYDCFNAVGKLGLYNPKMTGLKEVSL